MGPSRDRVAGGELATASRRPARITCLLALPRISIFEIERSDVTLFALANDASAMILDDEQVDRLIAILSEHEARPRVRGAAHARALRAVLADRRGDARGPA